MDNIETTDIYEGRRSRDLLAGFATRAEIARQFDTCERTVARYENEPDGLPSVLIGGRKYYRFDAVREWLARRERRPNPRRAAAKRASSTQSR